MKQKAPEGGSDFRYREYCRPSGALASVITESLGLAPKAIRFRRSAAELCNFKTYPSGYE